MTRTSSRIFSAIAVMWRSAEIPSAFAARSPNTAGTSASKARIPSTTFWVESPNSGRVLPTPTQMSRGVWRTEATKASCGPSALSSKAS